MRVYLTGGAGDLGQILAKLLVDRGDTPVCLDVRLPREIIGIYHEGSILDLETLERTMRDTDCLVHMAAWHGIHEVTGQKNHEEFWDLNVTGTFYVFETAAKLGINRIVYISSTSVEDKDEFYGFTKRMGEAVATRYAEQYQLQIIILRPRAFIPYWNLSVYKNYIEWAHWFWQGSVHITDVTQAVMLSLACIERGIPESPLVLTVDGAYEYTWEDLDNWDSDGPGSTFRKYYPEFYDMAISYGLDPALPPTRKDITRTRDQLHYTPTFSLRTLLKELQTYGEAGPPPP